MLKYTKFPKLLGLRHTGSDVMYTNIQQETTRNTAENCVYRDTAVYFIWGYTYADLDGSTAD